MTASPSVATPPSQSEQRSHGRKRPPPRPRPRPRPRRLKLVELPRPSSAAKSIGGSFLYEYDAASLLLETRRIVRPLQPMSVLATTRKPPTCSAGTISRGTRVEDGGGGGRQKKGEDVCPLLCDFLASIGQGRSTCTGRSTAAADDDDDVRSSVQEGQEEEMGDQFAEVCTQNTADNPTCSGDDPRKFRDDEDGNLPAKEAATVPSTATADSNIEPIDDTSRASLSRGQHSRYLHLLSELNKSGKRTFDQGTPKAREFKALTVAVEAERSEYHNAMEEFRERSVERFLVGFVRDSGPASNFVDAGSWLISRYRQKWITSLPAPARPLRYGKCVQEISLRSVAAGTCMGMRFRSSESGQRSDFDLGSYNARIIHSTSAERLPRMRNRWTKSACESNTLIPPSRARPLALGLISDDEKAIELAAKHNADVVMAAATFYELVRRPGHESTRWMIPQSSRDAHTTSKSDNDASFIILEEPIPRRATTREWLTRGFEESIFESASSLSSSDCNQAQQVYTLITLPPSGRHHTACKVLIRSTNTIVDDAGRPIHLGVHLEYFHERGLAEEFTHHERSIWLAHKLLQPDSRVLMTRIDPNSSRIVSVEEKSPAHALAVSEGAGGGPVSTASLQLPEFDASAHFGALTNVIRASIKLECSERRRYLLCLPGRDLASTTTSALTTVSVHREVVDQSAGTDDSNGRPTVINMEEELDEANSAFTNSAALMSCYLPWEWQDNGKRAPFTFPLCNEKL